jgi:hypothetical protein
MATQSRNSIAESISWDFVIRTTCSVTAIALFLIAAMFFSFSEFQFDRPMLVNDLGRTVLPMQNEFHFKMDAATGWQFKTIGATYGLIGVFLFAGCCLVKQKRQGD